MTINWKKEPTNYNKPRENKSEYSGRLNYIKSRLFNERKINSYDKKKYRIYW
jgi:hypothetical protein